MVIHTTTDGNISHFLNTLLSVEKVQDKYTKNGLTVSPNPRKPVKKVGFAVDASIETFEKARIANCDFLIVHHGLFFGNFQNVTNENYNRVRYLIDHNISLYSVHIPLDVHPKIGNNVTLSNMIGAESIGFYGYGLYSTLKNEITLENIKKKYDTLFSDNSKLLDFCKTGNKKVKNILICSGSGSSVLREYLNNPYLTYGQLDSNKLENKKIKKLSEINLPKPNLFITGEQDHSIYALAKEAGVSVLFLGHYLSETTGIKALMPIIQNKFKIPVKFIEARTGL